jgi:hypothetical protein
MYKKRFGKWKLWNYPISGCHNNEFSSVNTLHERKQLGHEGQAAFVSVCRVYSRMSIDNILMWLCEV